MQTVLKQNGYLFEDLTSYNFTQRLRVQVQAKDNPLPGIVSGFISGRATYNTDVTVNVYETYTDYDFHWIGKWHDVIDRRDNFSLEWVKRDEDFFGTVPQSATVTKVFRVLEHIQVKILTI